MILKIHIVEFCHFIKDFVSLNGLFLPRSKSLWWAHGPLARYVKLRVRMPRECRERFPRHRRWAIPTCITARASRTCRDACRDRQLLVSFEIGGGGKRSRHSRRMRNLQFYVSGKRPMVAQAGNSLSNQRASLSRSLATDVSIDKQIDLIISTSISTCHCI